MVFQDPISSLDPVYRIGDQIVEQIREHRPKMSKGAALERAAELMTRVGIPHANDRLRSFPHEFSGGMRQRVMIAMALSCDPEAADRRRADDGARRDDPGADPRASSTSCAERTGTGIVFVTHDLGVVADIADRILVMYGGRIVEQGTVDEVFYDPQHPYTWGLLGSIPRVDGEHAGAPAGDPGSAAVAARAARRGATSRRAARTLSPAARRSRASSSACPTRPGTSTAAGCARTRSARCARSTAASASSRPEELSA